MKSEQKDSAAKLRAFEKKIHSYYKTHRRDLPWRRTKDPYHILVSEVMLQQTQVDRVIPKYELFLKKFPTITALADAPLKDVLLVWQGLGYNRRAKFLQDAARIIVRDYGGAIPQKASLLEKLPAIGPYTAAAIVTFAFGGREVFIETNIRSVYIDYFFSKAKKVRDTELLPLIKKTLPKNHTKDWYFALMDYGSSLKKKSNPSRKSAHFTRQTKFKGSHRELRGAVLRLLSQKPQTFLSLKNTLGKDPREALTELKREGFVAKRGSYFTIA